MSNINTSSPTCYTTQSFHECGGRSFFQKKSIHLRDDKEQTQSLQSELNLATYQIISCSNLEKNNTEASY